MPSWPPTAVPILVVVRVAQGSNAKSFKPQQQDRKTLLTPDMISLILKSHNLNVDLLASQSNRPLSKGRDRSQHSRPPAVDHSLHHRRSSNCKPSIQRDTYVLMSISQCKLMLILPIG